mgnify:CR=1 FL=1
MYDVIALGELLVDLAERTKDENGYPTLAANPGGAPGNFLAALSAYGKKTAFLAKVGNDTFGHLLTGTMRRAGIDTRGILISSDTFTTLAFVTLDDSGNREFSFARKPGADTQLRFDEIDLGVIDASKVLHFGTLSMTNEPARDATYKAVEYAAGRGKLISFDPNLRKPLWNDLDEAKRQMLWGLRHADVVKISDEETEFLFSLAPEESAKHIINSFGVRLVYVTCGAEGCFYRTKTASGFVKALSGIAVKDTTGAGDIFGGSAMYGLLRAGGVPEKLTAEELENIVSFACASAGLSTTRAGGISSVAELIEVEAAMK